MPAGIKPVPRYVDGQADNKKYTEIFDPETNVHLFLFPPAFVYHFWRPPFVLFMDLSFSAILINESEVVA